MNGGGVIQRALPALSSSFAKALHPRRAERRRSRAFIGILAAVGTIAALIFLRELPNLRRYIRIERM